MSAAATFEARMVRVKIEQDKDGFFYATSPDLRGLVVSETTIPALEKHIEIAIMDMYRACGEDVLVTRLKDHLDDNYRPWVALPVEATRQALAAH